MEAALFVSLKGARTLDAKFLASASGNVIVAMLTQTKFEIKRQGWFGR